MIQVLRRAIGILELVSTDPKGFTVIELAERLSLNRATCSNIVKTLVDRGYLINVRSARRFILGAQAYGLVRRRYFMHDQVMLAKPFMDKLSQELKVPSVLVTIFQNQCYVIYSANPELGTPRDEDIVHVKDISEKATGRLLLAYCSEAERNLFFTEHAAAAQALGPAETRQALFEQIRHETFSVKESGFLKGLAVPIYSGDTVVAALGVYMPKTQCPKDQEVAYNKPMQTTAEMISWQFTRSNIVKQ